MTTPINVPQFERLIQLLLQGHEVTWGTETHAYRINPDDNTLEERHIASDSIAWHESSDSFNDLLNIDRNNLSACPPRIYRQAPQRPSQATPVSHIRRVEL